jgi:hypothetical protein
MMALARYGTGAAAAFLGTDELWRVHLKEPTGKRGEGLPD